MSDNPKDAEAGLPPIKTSAVKAMKETIHGQGLSMVAMGNELREKDATIAVLREERDAAARRVEALEAEVEKGGQNVSAAPPAAAETKESCDAR
jgi:hypothetical protein